MFGYIYLTKNLITNKIYIGQHKSKKYKPSYLGSGKRLVNSIAKYGKDNFEKSILDTADSKEELDLKEKYYISLYNSTDKEIGYNIALGGSGAHVLYQTQETKDKISKANTGKKRSEECIAKMSEDRKGGIWVNNGLVNKHIFRWEIDEYLSSGWIKGMKPGRKRKVPMPDELKERIRQSNLGKKKPEGYGERKRQEVLSKKLHWYTNGIENKQLSEYDIIPEGFYRGRTLPKRK